MKTIRESKGHGKRARQAAFLKAIVLERGCVSKACERCGIVRQTHYAWLEVDPAYGTRYEAARSEAESELQADAERMVREHMRAGRKRLLRFCRQAYGDELVDAILAGDESALLPR